jgi:hypothetical protein
MQLTPTRRMHLCTHATHSDVSHAPLSAGDRRDSCNSLHKIPSECTHCARVGSNLNFRWGGSRQPSLELVQNLRCSYTRVAGVSGRAPAARALPDTSHLTRALPDSYTRVAGVSGRASRTDETCNWSFERVVYADIAHADGC